MSDSRVRLLTLVVILEIAAILGLLTWAIMQDDKAGTKTKNMPVVTYRTPKVESKLFAKGLFEPTDITATKDAKDGSLVVTERVGTVRVLGANKTWRGLLSGAVAATLALWVQQVLVRGSVDLQSFVMPQGYASLPVLLVGPLFAIGTLGGDALKSFFKRQRHIQPGKPWFPFDQIDILGGAIAVMPFLLLSFWQYFWLVFVCLFAQIGFSYLGYWIGMKEKPL